MLRSDSKIGDAIDVRHDLLLDFSEEPLFEGPEISIKVGYPYPIHAPLNVADKKDSVRELLEVKENYNKSLSFRQQTFTQDNKRMVFYEKNNKKYSYLTKRMLEFYDKGNPDTYFDCDYNYYYTGGVLDHIIFDNTDYLIYATPESIHLLDVPNGKLQDLSCQNYTPVCGLNKLQMDYFTAYICLRGKNNVSLAKLTDALHIEKMWSEEYDKPILDAKLIKGEMLSLGLIQANGLFSLRDIELNADILMFEQPRKYESDLFQHFKVLDDNTCILINRYQVSIIDYREGSEVKVFEPKFKDCNTLCNFAFLNNDLLLVTRHYVLKTDMRFMNDASHYAHSLTSAPLYVDVVTDIDSKFLCISGHEYNDRVIFGSSPTFSAPFNIPALSHALNECISNNPSLLLKPHLTDRISYSLTGMKLLNVNNEIFIYTINSMGELFKQKINPSSIDTSDAVAKLSEWIKSMENPTAFLYVTDTVDMRGAFSTINNGIIVEDNLEKFNNKGKLDEFLLEFAPYYSKRNINSQIAKDFLSVWETEEDEDRDDALVDEVPARDKVESWIQMQSFTEDSANFSLQSFLKED